MLSKRIAALEIKLKPPRVGYWDRRIAEAAKATAVRASLLERQKAGALSEADTIELAEAERIITYFEMDDAV